MQAKYKVYRPTGVRLHRRSVIHTNVLHKKRLARNILCVMTTYKLLKEFFLWIGHGIDFRLCVINVIMTYTSSVYCVL